MKIEVDVKIHDKERLKRVGEKLTREIIKSGFKGDIEVIGLLTQLLDATGANTVKIYNELVPREISPIMDIIDDE